MTGADGVATHTDAEGRFTLAVMRGLRTQLRVSAEGHADAVQSFGADAFVEPEVLAFDLEPVVVAEQDDSGTTDPDAVVRWSTAEWVAERFSRGHAEALVSPDLDGAVDIDGGATPRRSDPPSAGPSSAGPPRPGACPLAGSVTPEAADPPILVEGRPAPWLGAGGTCADCHRDARAGIQANLVVAGVHAGLGDSCLSCHADDGAFEPRSCSRCHGNGISFDSNSDTWSVELDTGLAAPVGYEAALARAREAMRRRVEGADTLTRWVKALTDDGSRGAHDPRLVQRLYNAAAP